MPDRIAQNLVMFIRQQNGALSMDRRYGEFTPLTAHEVRRIERIVADAFEGFVETPGAPEAAAARRSPLAAVGTHNGSHRAYGAPRTMDRGGGDRIRGCGLS